MSIPEFEIKEVTLDEFFLIFHNIPELDPVTDSGFLAQRVGQQFFIALIAYASGIPVGFKLGYAQSSSVFYSWLGGVHPQWRRQGVASLLADAMEEKAKSKGFQKMVFKTRNCYKEMLIFGLNRGYQIIGFEERNEVSQHRILLEKQF